MNYQSAVDLNNEGVSFLVAGNDEMATQFLSESLRMVKVALTTGQQSPKSFENLSSSCSQAEKSSFVFSDSFAHITKPLQMKSVNAGDESTFIYDCCIQMNTKLLSDADGSDDATQNALNLLSAIIIFNLALLHHRRGRNGIAADLSKSLKMYQLCARLVRGSLMQRADCTTSLLLLLAATNNASEIFSELGSVSDAKKSFHEMAVLIQEAHNLLRPSVSEAEWSGFMSNVLMIHYTATAAAAA